MRSVLLIIATLFLLSCTKENPEPQTVNATVDRIIFPHIALGSNAGIIAGIIHKGKTEIYSYGEKELGTRLKLTPETTLELGSVTKVFTSLALADMVVKSEVKLDDPIELYFPANVKIPSKNGVKITLRNLANHTSGLPRLADNIDKDAFNPYENYDKVKLFEFLNNYKLPWEPGTKTEYSNVGYGLLGYILSLKNHSDFETLITDRILKPLNMNHTFVKLTAERLLNQAPGYNGSKKTTVYWSQQQQDIFQGTGSLSSNMQDMLIYLEANMGLKPSALTNAINLAQTRTFQNTGLGWNFHYPGDGQELVLKNGQNGSFSSFIGFNKITGTGVVILSNSSLYPDLILTNIGIELLKKLKSL